MNICMCVVFTQEAVEPQESRDLEVYVLPYLIQ